MMWRVLKENRPGLMVLLMVLLACAGSLAVGTVMWTTGDVNDTALMLVLFGAIVIVFVVVGVAITVFSGSFQRQSSSLPYSDRPPKYRDTWRRQHLESLSQSQATDTIRGASSLGTGRRTSDTHFSRLDVRSLWCSLPGVHSSSRRATSASMTNEHTTHDIEMCGRPVRANTVPACDEGLPTYEEAMGR